MKFIASSKAYSMVGDLRLEAEYIETLEQILVNQKYIHAIEGVLPS